MSFSSFARLLHSRWCELAGALWPDPIEDELQAEFARLDAELQRCHRKLVNCCKKIEKLRYHGQHCEEQLKQLAGTDSGQERERGQQKLDRLRQRLHERERRYLDLLTRFNRRKQDRKALRQQLLALPPRARQRIREETSDSGYPF